MPREKEFSHKKIIEAARIEFLENGFENASIRSIGKRAGITSAGLYRHCIDKEDLFCQVIEPLTTELDEFFRYHKKRSDEALKTGVKQAEAFDNGTITVFQRVSIKYRDEMKILLCRASGTRYENFLDNLVRTQESEMFSALDALKEQGRDVDYISQKEMHMLLSAYMTAIMEPIIHDYTEAEMKRCHETVMEFFMPGWLKIMGF